MILGGEPMASEKLNTIANELAGKVSRFELAQLKGKGLRGEGPFAGLSIFDVAEVVRLYELKRWWYERKLEDDAALA